MQKLLFEQEKIELTKLTSTISVNINPAEKEFLSQPGGEKPDSARVSKYMLSSNSVTAKQTYQITKRNIAVLNHTYY